MDEQRYEADSQKLFCRHCGRTTAFHRTIKDRPGFYCVAPAHHTKGASTDD